MLHHDCDWVKRGNTTGFAISSCPADLFADGVVPDSKAMWPRSKGLLMYQFASSLALTYYLLVGCFLYYAAHGQGLLHDKLFTELDMNQTHVVALCLWLLATFGAVLSLAVMWVTACSLFGRATAVRFRNVRTCFAGDLRWRESAPISVAMRPDGGHGRP